MDEKETEEEEGEVPGWQGSFVVFPPPGQSSLFTPFGFACDVCLPIYHMEVRWTGETWHKELSIFDGAV
jgi:hypothetical protein